MRFEMLFQLRTCPHCGTEASQGDCCTAGAASPPPRVLYAPYSEIGQPPSGKFSPEWQRAAHRVGLFGQQLGMRGKLIVSENDNQQSWEVTEEGANGFSNH